MESSAMEVGDKRLYWRRAAIALFVCAGIGALVVTKAVPCGFAALTHLPCPGCGSTRAVLALLAGDLRGVLRFNPLGPFVALLLGIVGVQSMSSLLTFGDLRRVGGPWLARVAMLLAALEIGVWVARFCGAFGGPVPV